MSKKKKEPEPEAAEAEAAADSGLHDPRHASGALASFSLRLPEGDPAPVGEGANLTVLCVLTGR